MKVLFIFPYISIVELISNTLPAQLAKRGYNIKIACYNKDKILSSDVNMDFYSIYSINISIPRLIEEFPYFIRLKDVIRQIQPDLIHINNLPFLTSLQSTVIAHGMRIPSILHVHGVIGMRNKILELAQYAFIRTLMRRAFRDATRVICLTKSDALEVQRLGCPYEKIRIVPNGVDTEKFKPRRETRDNYIFWGGRFVPEKGLEYLIKSLNLVVKERPEVKLVMAGGGPLFSKIHRIAIHYGLEKNIVFKGIVAHNKMPALFGSASMYVLPSLKEGMPYALLEAMACGKAVIGSDVPGINDIITHGVNGLLVPPKNPKALADAITQLLEDKNLRWKLEQNARQLIVEKYSWKTITERIERVYFEVINELQAFRKINEKNM